MAGIEDAGFGAGGSLLTAIGAWFLFKGKVERIEARQDEFAKTVVMQGSCDKCHNSLHERMERFENKQDRMDEKQDRVLEILSVKLK